MEGKNWKIFQTESDLIKQITDNDKGFNILISKLNSAIKILNKKQKTTVIFQK